MHEWLRRHLACPRDRNPLKLTDDRLTCTEGHHYLVIEGIPVMLFDDGSPTHPFIRESLEQVARIERGAEVSDVMEIWETRDGHVDEFVQGEIPYTCGHLYSSIQNKIKRYPFPEFRLPDGGGKWLLDVGCSWGRWTIAALKKGYRAVGVDPSIESLLAAARVARQQDVDALFVAADARFLPFAADSFDAAFSYSVIQHFKKPNARASFAEMARVTRKGGNVTVQMANKYGIRCLYHQARLGFQEGREGHDVIYWTPSELKQTFAELVGPTDISVDCYFGLNIQRSDADMLPLPHRMVIHSSELVRMLSKKISPLIKVADSLYISSTVSDAPR